jgi:predicted Zn-dependent protease
MEDDAEQKSETYALQALEYDNDNPVAYQQLASVRLSQQRNGEAQKLLVDSLTKWLDPFNEDREPTYSERLNLVKLLLEVESYNSAFSVLQNLQREDEEHVELWYLYTCAYFHDPEDSKEENWKSARECAETCLKWYVRLEWEDEDLKASCEDMLKQIRESGIVPDKEENFEGEEDGDDDEWESDEDVEMQEAD